MLDHLPAYSNTCLLFQKCEQDSKRGPVNLIFWNEWNLGFKGKCIGPFDLDITCISSHQV